MHFNSKYQSSQTVQLEVGSRTLENKMDSCFPGTGQRKPQVAQLFYTISVHFSALVKALMCVGVGRVLIDLYKNQKSQNSRRH